MTGKCFASGIEEHRECYFHLRRGQSKCKYWQIQIRSYGFFKLSKESIRKKEDGPDGTVSENESSSKTTTCIQWAMNGFEIDYLGLKARNYSVFPWLSLQVH